MRPSLIKNRRVIMNILLFALLALTLIKPPVPPVDWVNGSPAAKVMQLASRKGSIGHGCPVQGANGYGVIVITARHLTETEAGEPLDTLTWSDNAGGSGVLKVIYRD